MGRELGREVYFDGRNKRQVQRMTDIAEIFPLIHDNLHIKVWVLKALKISSFLSSQSMRTFIIQKKLGFKILVMKNL